MICTVLMAVLFSVPAIAKNHQPELQTNQQFLENVLKPAKLDTADWKSVLGFVLSSLPDRVKVLPTENYYYFSFYLDGVKWAGNLRLDVADRDNGFVHFAYFKSSTPWYIDQQNIYHKLGLKNGVKVVRKSALEYAIGFGGTIVRFALNDLADVKPPAGVLLSGDEYIGPVFDESGIEFYLVFNKTLKVFHYLLNETQPFGDQLVPLENAPSILVGQRTGFAFYQDKYADRKILIGIYAGNSSSNNYLDGPFDQLPDNFIQGDALQKSIIATSPESKGKIDRFGNFDDGDTRFLISPYMQYGKVNDLRQIEDCVNSRHTTAQNYHACFSVTPSR